MAKQKTEEQTKQLEEKEDIPVEIVGKEPVEIVKKEFGVGDNTQSAMLTRALNQVPQQEREKPNLQLFTEEKLKEAAYLVKSKLLPDSVYNAEQVIVIMQKGHELGFSPMASFEHIVVINGKPSLDSAAIGTLLLKAGVEFKCTRYAEPVYEKDIRGEDRIYQLTQKDGVKKLRPATDEEIKANGIYLQKKKIDIVTEIEFRRKSKLDGSIIVHKAEFSLKDAEAAGLTDKDVWKKYFKNMLYWRALTKGGREFAPDATLGMVTTEELSEGNIVLDSEGKKIKDI